MLGMLPLLTAKLEDADTMASVWPAALLSTLDQMAGKTWVAKFERDGAHYQVKETISWADDKAFLRSEVLLTNLDNGKVLQSMGVLGYHPVRERVVLWTFSSGGDFAFGVQSTGALGDGLSFDVETIVNKLISWEVATTRVEADPPKIVVEKGPALAPGTNPEPVMEPIVYEPTNDASDGNEAEKGD